MRNGTPGLTDLLEGGTGSIHWSSRSAGRCASFCRS